MLIIPYANRLLVPLCAALLAGCSDLASSYGAGAIPASPPPEGVAGQPYSLPKATVRVALIRDNIGIALVVEQPRFVADTASSYILAYRPSPNSVDKIKVTVKDGLLSAVDTEADDQSAAILEKIGQLAFLAESALDRAGIETIAVYDLDPADEAQRKVVEQGINDALALWVKPLLVRDCDTAIRKALAIELPTDPKARAKKVAALTEQSRARTPVCDAASRYVPHRISLTVAYTPFALASGFPVAPCDVGVCARHLSPATIRFGVDGIGVASETISIPNRSAAVPYRLSRAVFTKATHKLTFENGTVASAETTKGSEALAIVGVPLNIVKGVVTTASELVQLKVDLTKKQKELADARKARRDAEDALHGIVNAGANPDSSEAAIDPDTLLIKAYLPGLGEQSGAGLSVAGAISNDGDSQAAARPAAAGKPPAAGKPDATVPGAAGAPGVDAGAQVQGGSDGKGN